MKLLRILLPGLAAVAAACSDSTGSGPDAGGSGYTPAALANVPGPYSSAVAVNAAGRIAGSYQVAPNVSRAYRWTAGTVEPLAGPNGEPFSSFAVATNDAGWVVGGYQTSAGPGHAAVWRPGEAVQDLGVLDAGGGSAAYGVNASGVVVGTSETTSGGRAFRWTAAGGMQALPSCPSATYAAAYDVNTSGVAVGSCTTGPGAGVAALWSPGAQVQVLPTIVGALTTVARAVNDAGLVVGSVQDAGGERPAVWRLNGAGAYEIKLLVLPAGSSGATSGIAFSVNADGAIVGFKGSLALYWSGPDAEPRVLAPLQGGENARAISINDAGVIVGDSRPSPAIDRAVIWKP
jgi:probable HAF family extracellular repeat protein